MDHFIVWQLILFSNIMHQILSSVTWLISAAVTKRASQMCDTFPLSWSIKWKLLLRRNEKPFLPQLSHPQYSIGCAAQPQPFASSWFVCIPFSVFTALVPKMCSYILVYQGDTMIRPFYFFWYMNTFLIRTCLPLLNWNYLYPQGWADSCKAYLLW